MASYNEVREYLQERKQIFVGGALHKKGIYLFTEHEELGNKQTFVVFYRPFNTDKGNEYNGKGITGAKRLKGVTHTRYADFVGVYNQGETMTHRRISDELADVKFNPDGIDYLFGITDIAKIDNEVFVCEHGYFLHQLIRNRKWKEHTIPITENTQRCCCIDGFNLDEIYVGGTKAMLMCQEKGEWREIQWLDITENGWKEDIEQIICADDGFVYARTHFNKVLKGRKDDWEIIYNDENSYNHLKSMTYFKGNIYIVENHKTVMLVENNELQQVNGSEKVCIPSSINNMVANDDLLMITGDDKVIIFNGERWFVIFDKNQSEEQLREQGIFYDPREL